MGRLHGTCQVGRLVHRIGGPPRQILKDGVERKTGALRSLAREAGFSSDKLFADFLDATTHGTGLPNYPGPVWGASPPLAMGHSYAELAVSSLATTETIASQLYSLHLPTKGWPGWVGLSSPPGWIPARCAPAKGNHLCLSFINPSTNRARRSLTSLMWPTTLTVTLRQPQQLSPDNVTNVMFTGFFTHIRKGSGTCIALIVSLSTTKRSDVDHTQLPANTPHLLFLRISYINQLIIIFYSR